MLDLIHSIMESIGYMGIVLLMFIENVFPPIPSEVIMPAAGYSASRGELSLIGVIAAGTLGSLLGAYPLYAIGYFIGIARLARLVHRHGRWVGLSTDDLLAASLWFQKRGKFAVLIGRVIPGIRSLISIPAGIYEMNLLTFTGYTIIGSAVWTTLLAVAGWYLGRNFENVERYVGFASTAIIVVVVIAYLTRVIRHRHYAAKAISPEELVARLHPQPQT